MNSLKKFLRFLFQMTTILTALALTLSMISVSIILFLGTWGAEWLFSLGLTEKMLVTALGTSFFSFIISFAAMLSLTPNNTGIYMVRRKNKIPHSA